MRSLVIGSLALALGAPAAAQTDEFYKGKTVRLIVGIGVGSGYDVNARVLARHMAKHIPGKPAIVVRNMGGASGVIGMKRPTASPLQGAKSARAMNS
mgnify:CR=1 FL=1